MNRSSNHNRARPSIRAVRFALLIPLMLAGLPAGSAAARPHDRQEIRIALSDAAGTSRADVRRQIAAAARALCNRGGLAALYRNGARRCRQQVIADAERQLAAR